MRCPECGLASSVDSTRTVAGKVRRRRECRRGHRFTTYELLEDDLMRDTALSSAFRDAILGVMKRDEHVQNREER